MKATVTAFTKEGNSLLLSDIADLERFSGKNAGICYMKDQYFDTNITDPEKALKRFNSTTAISHHSIADHAKVTILFENISKIIAIILNSLQDYATSEKSGRYTEMAGNTEIERQLYDKWKANFSRKILETYPDMDSTSVDKLANENARYVLNIFTHSTTMSYTTSLRQFNYIIDWCSRYITECEDAIDRGISLSKFHSELHDEIRDLKQSLLNTNLFVLQLGDPKKRSFELMINHPNAAYPLNIEDLGHEIFGDTYRIMYKGSFVHLAQAQRHRTLKYRILFDGISDNMEFYIPPILQFDDPLREEWVSDLNSLIKLNIIPQGTLVQIVESGHIDDFVLKCKERLCGRAQLEIMMQTAATLNRMYAYRNFLGFYKESGLVVAPLSSPALHAIRQTMAMNGIMKTKCQLLHITCQEPCRYMVHNTALSRLI